MCLERPQEHIKMTEEKSKYSDGAKDKSFITTKI
jgi:hypothetical protein